VLREPTAGSPWIHIAVCAGLMRSLNLAPVLAVVMWVRLGPSE